MIQVYINERWERIFRVLECYEPEKIDEWQPIQVRLLGTYSTADELKEFFPELYSLIREYEISN